MPTVRVADKRCSRTLRASFHLAVLAATLVLGGCGTLARAPAVPSALQMQATVPGLPNIRYRDPDFDSLMSDLVITVQRERALPRDMHSNALPPVSFLAISGGGSNGAFGAGLLVGWTEHGDRPEFNIVTGVSTGALIAPFAFLGPKYDTQLKRLYTEISEKDILRLRSIVSAALFEDALADNLPLKALVDANITPEIMEALAVESAKGRMLLVGTTDLDAQRSVIWNLTLMAESRHPKALQLIRQILVASAAIPGELPPAMIDVEAGGKRYQEMHVDGGTTRQVFMLPTEIVMTEVARRQRTVYVIRNSRLGVESKEVERGALAIASRAIESLIYTQGIGDIYQIAAITRRDGAKLRLAFVPDSFERVPRSSFDQDYMNELFIVGYKLGREGYAWAGKPPGFAGE